MPQLKIAGFDGVIPRTSPTMLQDTQAQIAKNVKLYSRELRYWDGPKFEYTPADTDLKTLYKFYNAGAPIWLTWDTYVDVARSPITDVSDYRLYYTDGVKPKKTNYALATAGAAPYPYDYLYMGVPAPTGAPTCTRVGASVTSPEDRAYVYTYVSTFGAVKEESAPSPAGTVASVGVGDSVTVNGFAAAPTTHMNITHRRIYRSVAGASSDSYQFVAEIAIGTTSYSDSLTTAQLGEVIKTIGWVPPPDDLQGLVTHPSGSLVGFSGNTVYFSEPFFSQAWPLAYAKTVPDKIIGLGIYGTTVVVMTDRNPYLMSGVTPDAMSSERIPILEPCLSKQSIASDEFGVVYASPNGLVGIGPSMRGVITNGLFAYNEWQKYSPDLMAGSIINNQYFAIYPANADQFKTMVINRGDIPALSFVDMEASAVHVDSKGGNLYYIASDDGKIYKWDDDNLNPLIYTWKSKRFVLPQGVSFSCIKVDADYGQIGDAEAYNQLVAAIEAANAALFANDLLGSFNSVPLNELQVNGSILTEIPPLASVRSLQVLVYAEGELVATMDMTSFNPARLPPFKGRTIEVEIVGTVDCRTVQLATTVEELRLAA